MGSPRIEEALRLHPTWHNGGMDLPGPGGSIVAAAMAIAAGLCRHVLCFRTVWESTYATLVAQGAIGGHRGASRVSGPMQEWRAPFGALSAGNWIGMNANQYLHRYGAPREMLGLIALNARTNAGRNPEAIYREPLTMDDYLSARPITSPFGLYDCDVPCDASIAVIVSDASVAADLPHPAVRIEAVGTQILERVSWDQGTLTHEPQVIGQAAHLWTRTDLGPDDVDVALIYDGFTFNAISWLEGPRVLRVRRGLRLARGRAPHRPRRPTARQPARRPALGRPDARVRLRLRSGAAAAPRGGRPAGHRCRDSRGHERWWHAFGRAAPAEGRGVTAAATDRRVHPGTGRPTVH